MRNRRQTAGERGCKTSRPSLHHGAPLQRFFPDWPVREIAQGWRVDGAGRGVEAVHRADSTVATGPAATLCVPAGALLPIRWQGGDGPHSSIPFAPGPSWRFRDLAPASRTSFWNKDTAPAAHIREHLPRILPVPPGEETRDYVRNRAEARRSGPSRPHVLAGPRPSSDAGLQAHSAALICRIRSCPVLPSTHLD